MIHTHFKLRNIYLHAAIHFSRFVFHFGPPFQSTIAPTQGGAITEKAKALQQALTCSDETLEKMEEAGVSKNPATRLNSWNVKRFSRKLSNPFSFRTNATEGAPLEIPSASKEKEWMTEWSFESSVSSHQFFTCRFAFRVQYDIWFIYLYLASRRNPEYNAAS